MPSAASSGFNVLRDTRPEDHTLPAFMVSTTRGFLPRQEPVVTLPVEFDALESVLSRMPIKTATGAPGLLAEFKLGETVLKELPDLSSAIEKYQSDLPLMNALYRDYSFLASAYLLEPCHERFVRGEPYGLGRQRLPSSIARPIARVAELAGFKPFMEYAGSYALFNYRLVEPSKGLEYSNLRLIRAFEHGLDPTSSEAGFVLVHVDMVKQSGELVEGAADAIEGCTAHDRAAFDSGLAKVVSAMKKVNKVMDGMWNKSKPNDYVSFRTFIFGITSQSMFPHGVVYEGVSDEPLSFRGESGANDSMIPLCDNLLQIPMPNTPLTEILKDFRSYRPGNHREFLEWVKDRSMSIKLREYAMEEETSTALYLQILNQVREFRWRHWCFTREYILKKTAHPTATGGSPIVTWLPNQLQAVLDHMVSIYEKNPDKPHIKATCEDIMQTAYHQQDNLRREVDKYCRERNVNKE
ncbi:indoleamine 2,3-dioxygenase gamma type [Xylona heveae TC161]|uniref:Indoleamine 2,3-dioxygenase n=1 Tax=Xylona heveae (strain CBS 132557 / TC161) TaxID=1328760 RepID=A0A165I371_XYLHT|nr:indoleamine 2,3-dioxygenase gamma type [Xylona heveae TC161]KZF24310.1 indoleamine 2,3-dioxygenase gamma type [Xylona heveae TC161]